MESSKNTYPETGKIVQVQSFNNDDDIITNNEKISELAEGEALVKIYASPMNHYDSLKIQGHKGGTCPFTPGLEASGTVIEVKTSNKELIGQKVCFWAMGTMREYMRVKVSDLLILGDNIDLILGSVAYINPLTAYGLVEMVQSLNAKAFIQTASNSSVGVMVQKYSKYSNLEVINVVRSEERVKELKSQGFEHILNSSDPEFKVQLKEISDKLKASVAIDPIAGPLVGTLIKTLGNNGVYVNYGTQSALPMCDIDATDFRWQSKEIKSFLIFSWWTKKSQEEKNKIWSFIKDNLNTLFKQEIGTTTSMWDFSTAFKKFKNDHSTLKTILLTDK